MLRQNKDKRTKYVISNRKIFGGPTSDTYGKDPWKWKPYSGNPHDQHLHVSVADDPALYDDDSDWNIGRGVGVPNPIAPKKTLPVLRKGSKGFYVSLVQTCLGGSTADGDFGPMTHQAVLQFQRDHRLDDDGVVGVYTWRELLRPWAKEVNLLPTDPRAKLTEMALISQKLGTTASADELVKAYLVIFEDILPPEFTLPPVVITPPPTEAPLTEQIVAIASKSVIAKYPWKSRGVAPRGYVNGLALAFSAMLVRLQRGDSSALEMAKANTGNDEKDALSWLNSVFVSKGMKNDVAGPDTLRHLFVLLMGLGMRESSGHHCEGRDQSASNTSADTCEAGLFQQSYDSHSASKEIDKLFDEYTDDTALCFLGAFAEGVQCSTKSWENYGTSKGREFQKLCKNCPGFAVASAAVCLRVLRKHFGPINRREVEIMPAADVMFADVQRVVEAAGSAPALVA